MFYLLQLKHQSCLSLCFQAVVPKKHAMGKRIQPLGNIEIMEISLTFIFFNLNFIYYFNCFFFSVWFTCYLVLL